MTPTTQIVDRHLQFKQWIASHITIEDDVLKQDIMALCNIGLEAMSEEQMFKLKNVWAARLLGPNFKQLMVSYLQNFDDGEAKETLHAFSGVDTTMLALSLAVDTGSGIDISSICSFLKTQLTGQRIPDYRELDRLPLVIDEAMIEVLLHFWDWWLLHKREVRHPWLLTYLLGKIGCIDRAIQKTYDSKGKWVNMKTISVNRNVAPSHARCHNIEADFMWAIVHAYPGLDQKSIKKLF